MAAGLGFKDFTTGEVLTAADVDGYLMQGIWVFASAAARDAAVTSPQEGNFAFLKDTNTTTYYTGSAWTNLDTTGMVNPMTTTGDTIYSSSGSTPARLGIGTAGQVLTVNAGATAPEWKTPASGSTFAGCALTKSASQTISNNTGTFISFNGEDFDTDNFHDNSTNNTRITIPSGKAGKYQVNLNLQWAANTSGTRYCMLYKNGTVNFVEKLLSVSTTGGYAEQFLATIMDLTVGDYIEAKVDQSSGGNLDVWGDNSLARGTSFSVSYLGA
jgi:hypothetical protein